MDNVEELDLDQLDLEELESRLYSQIHHSSVLEESDTNIICDDSSTDPLKCKYRYFECASPDTINNPQSYSTPLTNIVTDCSTSNQQQPENCLHAAVESTESTNTDNINLNSVINYSNIKVNPYSIPPLITTNNLRPKRTRVFPVRYSNEIESYVEPIKRRSKRNKHLQKSSPTKPVVTIFISDSDSDDCIEVTEDMSSGKKTKRINTKFPKKYNEADGGRPPEPDDDVIFIPPPPVEVITVDFDENSPKSLEKSKQSENNIVDSSNKPEEQSDIILTPESPLSNDFLDTANLEPNSNFNFDLHGTDFNSGSAERTQSSKPTQYCETESSCSTNEHSRDFSNTVKTIVFDEIEFPKEDIFSEKNLESFGSFITPRRSPSKPKKSVAKTKKDKTVKKDLDVSSDTSSSESDYEITTSRKSDSLPNLSPMVSSCSTLRTKIKKSTDFFKDRIVHGIQGDISSSKGSTERSKKAETSESNTERSKDSEKKKRKRGLETEIVESSVVSKSNVEDDSITTSTPNTKTKAKKKKRDYSESGVKEKSLTDIVDSLIDKNNQSTDSKSNSDNDKSKKKKKKRNSSCKNFPDCSIEEENESNMQIDDISHNDCAQFLDKSKNKKKKRSISTSKFLTDNTISKTESVIVIDNQPEQSNCEESVTLEATQNKEDDCNSDKSKKRKKKKVSTEKNKTETLDNIIESLNENIQDVATDIQNYENLEKPKKKKKQESSASENIEISPNDQVKVVENIEKSIDDIKELKTNPIINIPSTIDESVNATSQDILESENDKSTSKTKNISENSVPEDITTVDSTLIIPNVTDVEQIEIVATQNVDSEKSQDKQPIVLEEKLDENTDADSEIILLDSDTPSEHSELIISSDSDIDFEVLDDVGNDLSLNCLVRDDNLKSTQTLDIDNDDYERIVGKFRVPLTNYEKFDLATIQSQQSDDPEKWAISYRDRATYLHQGGARGPRCYRCRQFGHTGIKCPDKAYPPPCFLCGKSDHEEPRCPNKKCTQCGNEGTYSTTYCYRCFKFRNTVCRLCGMFGHIENTCPDLWRRYHLTTDQGPMVVAQQRIKPRDQLWCSGCARRGHLEHECNYYNRQFPPTTPFIINYEDNLRHNELIESQKANTKSLPETSTTAPITEPSKDETTPTEIPSILSLPVSRPLVNVTPTVNRIIIPSLTTPNLTIQVSNDSTNIPTVQPNEEIIFQVTLNFDNLVTTNKEIVEKSYDVDLDDLKQIKNLILKMPPHVVTSFIEQQIDYLHKSNVDPRLLKRKIFRFDRISDSKKNLTKKLLREKNFWYRTLNMFVFGTHKYKDGKLHVNYLKRYLSQANNSRLDDHKRASLLSSYSYIFGCNKHFNVNYYKIMRLLIRKYYSNNTNVKQ